MKWLFYSGSLLVIVFELANVYFIMPMPGSQAMESIGVAYFLYTWRWMIRSICAVMMLTGIWAAWKGSPWVALLSLSISGAIAYMVNWTMVADHMFLQPEQLILADAQHNRVDPERLIIGISFNGQARAYPIQFLGYHHQVRDTIQGKSFMVTYCTVCRTGRVYEPVVKGHEEIFRLVGMDHFNAMFEDKSTKSWWRQVTGEAIAGPLKGEFLPEYPCTQTSLQTWFQLYPSSLIMQPDPDFTTRYDAMRDFETGRKEGTLTVYDTSSWHDKSWIAGVAIGEESKAYDWNEVKKKKIIHDQMGQIPILLFVTDHNRSIFGFVRNRSDQQFELRNDTLWSESIKFDLMGHSLQPGVKDLDKINVYQEYWHSWKTFHPNTSQFGK